MVIPFSLGKVVAGLPDCGPVVSFDRGVPAPTVDRLLHPWVDAGGMCWYVCHHRGPLWLGMDPY